LLRIIVDTDYIEENPTELTWVSYGSWPKFSDQWTLRFLDLDLFGQAQALTTALAGLVPGAFVPDAGVVDRGDFHTHRGYNQVKTNNNSYNLWKSMDY
jgi:hypothetical protein